MVDIALPWVVDTPLSTRFPVYTRANVGEVSPSVATPLFWSQIGGAPAERVWKQVLVDFGAFDADEFREVIDIQGMLHGYVYLNLSNLRVFGARMPGASPELMDRTYLGERSDVPPYEPHPDDDKPEYTERILASVGRVFATEHRDDFLELAGQAAKLRAERPDYSSMSDAELVALQRVRMNEYLPFLYKHLLMVYESSLVTGMLEQTLAPLGDPTLTARLMGGLGNIASAAPTGALWQLSRLVVASPVLTAAFEAGVFGLLGRLADTDGPGAEQFRVGWDAFISEYGSRSTNEWEAMPQTWETHPQIPLGLVERMRLQPEDRDPALRSQRLRADREDLTAKLRDQLADSPEALGALDLALRLVGIYLPARELSKTSLIRVLHEARLPMRALALRHVAAGLFARPEDITMLREDELDAFVADPAASVPTITERWAWHAALAEREPPYLVKAGEVPPVASWELRTEPSMPRATSGEILTGLAACPGVASGRARVIRDPADAHDLEPGEILVAPMTDPGWTPLFTSAEAVVVDIGATLSHAAIVSRELGIPCVLGVTHASLRIPDGAMLTVDGTAGLVTVH
ncbi:PEP-utilizing enzyme [Sporichthya sp.]|uniref:PEP-utilizing enzyme n=1 Tax=Sporichthya sp. TaxID=65475 RepID=UPI0017D4D36A|nr:PEP-utilizing enzyme [Sporichthya sp.]MBA3741822.1 phosphoenolpyruvate-utilizing protein [Sporichthya sp.]